MPGTYKDHGDIRRKRARNAMPGGGDQVRCDQDGGAYADGRLIAERLIIAQAVARAERIEPIVPPRERRHVDSVCPISIIEEVLTEDEDGRGVPDGQ